MNEFERPLKSPSIYIYITSPNPLNVQYIFATTAKSFFVVFRILHQIFYHQTSQLSSHVAALWPSILL